MSDPKETAGQKLDAILTKLDRFAALIDKINTWKHPFVFFGVVLLVITVFSIYPNIKTDTPRWLVLFYLLVPTVGSFLVGIGLVSVLSERWRTSLFRARDTTVQNWLELAKDTSNDFSQFLLTTAGTASPEVRRKAALDLVTQLRYHVLERICDTFNKLLPDQLQLTSPFRAIWLTAHLIVDGDNPGLYLSVCQWYPSTHRPSIWSLPGHGFPLSVEIASDGTIHPKMGWTPMVFLQSKPQVTGKVSAEPFFRDFTTNHSSPSCLQIPLQSDSIGGVDSGCLLLVSETEEVWSVIRQHCAVGANVSDIGFLMSYVKDAIPILQAVDALSAHWMERNDLQNLGHSIQENAQILTKSLRTSKQHEGGSK